MCCQFAMPHSYFFEKRKFFFSKQKDLVENKLLGNKKVENAQRFQENLLKAYLIRDWFDIEY